MQFRGMSRSHLFLIELIVVILFFSFASAITILVFNKSHELAEDSTALNGAIMAVQTAAESDRIVGFSHIDTDPAPIYFDSSWRFSNPSDAVYTLKSDVALEKREAGSMAVYSYNVTAGEEAIYSLQTKKYYPGEFAVEEILSEAEGAEGLNSGSDWTQMEVD